jgi:hypothetical protein
VPERQVKNDMERCDKLSVNGKVSPFVPSCVEG